MAPRILGYELYKGIEIIIATKYGQELQNSYLLNNHSTFVYFQLCALFTNQMMFAVGGAASFSTGLSGNPKGRVNNRHSKDVVFSGRLAVAL